MNQKQYVSSQAKPKTNRFAHIVSVSTYAQTDLLNKYYSSILKSPKNHFTLLTKITDFEITGIWLDILEWFFWMIGLCIPIFTLYTQQENKSADKWIWEEREIDDGTVGDGG